MYPVRRQISPHAARLRRDMTDAEKRIWEHLRNRQLDDLRFRRQATIGPYVVDFLCFEAKLVVELDGGQHNEEADRARTTFLESEGYRVLRFWNHDALQNTEGVLETIAGACR